MPPTLTLLDEETAIFGRAIDPSNWSMSPAAAEAILDLRLPDPDRQRMNELAEKARQGELTVDEEIAIESYRQVGCLIELMKSKARLALRKFRS